jgi:hypothetical protein
MRSRRLSAFGVSAALHVFAVVAAVVFEARSSATVAPPDASSAKEPTVVVVESLPPPATLTETDAPPDTLGIRVSEES